VLSGAAPALRTQHVGAAFLPAPAHTRWSRNELELLGRTVSVEGGFDWDFDGEGTLWAFHLHQFDYARSPAVSAEQRSALLLDWIDRHTGGTGWKPHPISLRIFSWAKLLLTPEALSLSPAQAERVQHSLACQIETLDRSLEVRLQANHLLSNLLGVVAGALLLDGPRSRHWLRRLAWLEWELGDQIASDGSHVERSPMYQALLLENLLDLLNLASSVGDAAPRPLVATLEDCAARMLGAHRVWTHPDGEIALFADSALGIAHSPAALEEYASSLGVTAVAPPQPGVLEAGGYVRLAEGPFTLIASVGGPMPSHQPGHAHCDALSFELSVGSQRVVTDTGVSEYVAGARRDLARATRSHSTIEVDGREQAEIWAAHRVGGRPRVQLLEVEPGRSFEASCSGWSTPDSVHRRHVRVDSEGVEIRDCLEGPVRPVRSHLPLAPGLEPILTSDAQGRQSAGLELDAGVRLRIELPGELDWRIERSAYFPRFGSEEQRACLVGEASAFRSARLRFKLVG
jgi:uncharacterized heparinase superfamily protein